MNWRRVPFAAARWSLIGARSLALRSPRLSEWITRRIRRFPWLYLKLVAVFSEETAYDAEKPLITPELTPATKTVISALRAEMARADSE